MPQLKGKKWFNSRKEKNAIAKRLMQISLKVDDYVYKHKPITESDAEMYIQEVTSYNSKCSQDVRSLQVIEKLTRCMKSIITERQELNKSSFTRNRDTSTEEVATRVIPISPVYSLPDEDRNHLTQTNLVIASESSVKSDPAISDISRNNKRVDENIIDTAIQIERDNNIGDADIKRHISCLSSKESEFSQVSKAVIENSQSILDNHVNIESMLQDANVTCINLIKGVDTKLKDVVNDMNKSVENYIRKIDPTMAKTIKPLEINALDSDKTLNVNNNGKQASPKTKAIRKRKFTPRKKKTDTKVKESIINEKTGNKSSKKMNTIRKARKIAEYKTDLTSRWSSNKHKDVSLREIGISNPNLTSPADIYNENTENDLSWLENIRYVREVSAEEFDPKLADMDPGFWENYTLPDCWDDQDFEYSP